MSSVRPAPEHAIAWETQTLVLDQTMEIAVTVSHCLRSRTAPRGPERQA